MQRRAMPATQSPRVQKWLPDAELDPHPFCSWLLELGFDLWIHLGYDRVVLAPDGFHVAPGSLIASNHQRDVDGPMLGTVLVRRRGLRFLGALPFYATREDLFRPGILARLTVHWPRSISTLLGRISLAWFFPLGRTEPIRRVREFTLGEALHALCEAGLGDADCATLLNARGRRETNIETGALSVREAANHRDLPLEEWWGLRRLTLPAIKKLAPAFRATVNAQLVHFAQRLNDGRCVYFSPEGTISLSGRFGRVRAGCFRLVHMSESAPWVQPMALSYDTLAPGRSRVLVRIGQRFRADLALDRRAFDAALRHAVLSLAPITPSHLLARFLLHGPQIFSERDLAAWFSRGRATLQARGTALDPLFARVTAEELAGQRLRWLERRQLVARAGEAFRNTCPRDAKPGWRKPAAIVRYLDNNLADLVPDIERALPC
ncbi:MAG TPA: hypothetical protein VFW60_05695 [Rhodanobacteraceae bacterium]|nr:hypothetical protein [Rhodanobacteraceae bacterium]